MMKHQFALFAAVALTLGSLHASTGEAIEPSIKNEVDHAMSIAKFAAPPDAETRAVVEDLVKGKNGTDAAIALVSQQRAGGSWLLVKDGRKIDYTAAAWLKLRELLGGRGPLKVLAIGNSFSVCLHRQWPAVSKAFGTELDLATLYIGGCELKRHAANIQETEKDPSKKQYSFCRNFLGAKLHAKSSIQEALRSEAWDVVTIQQASHESWKQESYMPYAKQITDCIWKFAPQAKIVIQETWSYNKADKRISGDGPEGAGSWGFTQKGMYDRLHANYLWLKNEIGAAGIIPMGSFVQQYRAMGQPEDVVGISSNGDTIHLNPDGDYMQALVWQKYFFGSDPRKCPYVPDSLAEKRGKLKAIRETVR